MRQGFVIVVCLAVCLGIAPAALAQEAELRALMEGMVRDERGIVFAREEDD